MRMKVFVALFGVLLFCFSLTSAQIWKDSPRVERAPHESISKTQNLQSKLARVEDVLRLPTDLIPSRQDIRIQPFLTGNFSTAGYTKIYFECMVATSVIKLHMEDIITNNATIYVENEAIQGQKLPFLSHQYDLPNQMYIGTLETPLEVGVSYFIEMEYEGFLNENLFGFYRSTYVDENNQTVIIGTTQMQPLYARRVFPCFDEPAFKVEFNIQILREGTIFETISNMPRTQIIEDTNQPGWYWDVFNTTYPMSTYLIAFIVSDFVSINRTTNDGRVLFKVWSREESIDQAQYALEKGPDVLSFYEEYYQILFPLPKQDMAALSDFDFGAMENWGLATYRESALLFDPIQSSASNKQRIAVIIAHELAHMWFGDLVTMEWWNGLWLNEGFATYMEALGTNSIEPTFGIFDQFVIINLQYVFLLDSLETSRPINIDVDNPVEINSLFDAISYSKGGSIIRMMRYFLTEPTFRQGLTDYLTTNSYGNAVQDDLWRNMTLQAADDNIPLPTTVKQIMDTWTLQMGYPVVSVVIGAGGNAALTQERFLSVANENSTDNGTYLWWVPITWTDSTNPTFDQQGATEWIPADTDILAISGLSTTADWYIFNVDQSGYYRVNYEVNNWQNLINQLNTDHEVLSIITRSQLIDDAMNLARAIPGRLNYTIALSVNDYLANEHEYVPWVSALQDLGYLEQMFTFSDGYSSLSKYMVSLLGPLYEYVTFDDNLTDPHQVQLTRSMALSWTCHLSQSECVGNSTALFNQWMADPSVNPISPNLKSTVYCTGVAAGGEAEWDFIYNQYLTENLATESTRFLEALGCSNNLTILSRYLDIVYKDSPSPVRDQDAYISYRSVANNDAGNQLAWDYLNTNWDQMASRFDSPTELVYYVDYAADEFNTEEKLAEVEALRDLHAAELGSSVSEIDITIETIQNNINWMDLYYDVVNGWLIDNGYST